MRRQLRVDARCLQVCGELSWVHACFLQLSERHDDHVLVIVGLRHHCVVFLVDHGAAAAQPPAQLGDARLVLPCPRSLCGRPFLAPGLQLRRGDVQLLLVWHRHALWCHRLHPLPHAHHRPVLEATLRGDLVDLQHERRVQSQAGLCRPHAVMHPLRRRIELDTD